MSVDMSPPRLHPSPRIEVEGFEAPRLEAIEGHRQVTASAAHRCSKLCSARSTSSSKALCLRDCNHAELS